MKEQVKAEVQEKQVSIVFSDIDGTALDSNHRVLPETKEAVQALAAKGIPFVLVSARMPAAIRTVSDEMGIVMPLISYGGALVLDGEGRTVEDRRIDPEDTVSIIERIKSGWGSDTVINYYAGDTWYVEDDQHPEVIIEEETVKVKSVQKEFGKLLAELIFPSKIMCISAPDVCADMDAKLPGEYPGLQIVRSRAELLEISTAGVKKSVGIQTLLDYLHMDAASAVAFGDNYNDLDMLEYVGTGVAMDNAPQPVKDVADAVTASNNEAGIAVYLKKIGLI